MNATPARLHCLSFLHLHRLTSERAWVIWTDPAHHRPLLRSPRGALYQLILLPQRREPMPKPCTFLAEAWQPRCASHDS